MRSVHAKQGCSLFLSVSVTMFKAQTTTCVLVALVASAAALDVTAPLRRLSLPLPWVLWVPLELGTPGGTKRRLHCTPCKPSVERIFGGMVALHVDQNFVSHLQANEKKCPPLGAQYLGEDCRTSGRGGRRRAGPYREHVPADWQVPFSSAG